MHKGKILTPLVLDESDKKEIIYYPINENDTPGEEKSNEDINKKNNKNESCNFALYLGSFSLSVIGLILIIKICLMIRASMLFVSINSIWLLLWFLNFFFFVSSINEKRHCVILYCFIFIGLAPSIFDIFISRRYLIDPGKAYIMAYDLLSAINIILYFMTIVLYCYHTTKIKSKK